MGIYKVVLFARSAFYHAFVYVVRRHAAQFIIRADFFDLDISPSRGWAYQRKKSKLAGSNDGDRQMVKILAAVLSEGLPGVEAACLEAPSEGVIRPTS